MMKSQRLPSAPPHPTSPPTPPTPPHAGLLCEGQTQMPRVLVLGVCEVAGQLRRGHVREEVLRLSLRLELHGALPRLRLQGLGLGVGLGLWLGG